MRFASFIAILVALAVFYAMPAKAGTVKLPRQCYSAKKVLCISKSDRKLRFVVNGRAKLALDARFGDARGSAFVTHEGWFTVFRKEQMSWSAPYQVYMPYSMYFSGGQAIHYSYSFVREGYAGSSHGCVNIRDIKPLAWLYARVPLGTPVFIY